MAFNFLKKAFSTSDMPGFAVPEVSPDTDNIIGVQQQRADMSPNQIVEEGIKGIPNEGAAQAKELSSFNRALGMASPDQLNEVLARRMEKSRESDLANLRRTQAPKAWMEKSNRQLRAGANQKRSAQINLEAQEGIRMAEAEKKKARNAMIGSMLGAVGSIAGGFLGSAGSKGGQMLGEGIAGGGSGGGTTTPSDATTGASKGAGLGALNG